MWIARNKNNKLCLFNNKPEKNNEEGYWFDNKDYYNKMFVLDNIFQKMTWNDEPVEVDFFKKS